MCLISASLLHKSWKLKALVMFNGFWGDSKKERGREVGGGKIDLKHWGLRGGQEMRGESKW